MCIVGTVGAAKGPTPDLVGVVSHEKTPIITNK